MRHLAFPLALALAVDPAVRGGSDSPGTGDSQTGSMTVTGSICGVNVSRSVSIG